MMDIFIFDVGLGQCVYFLPHDAPEYSMLVDCGHDGDFHPIDQLIEWDIVHVNEQNKREIGNLTLTNYDHDHFSGLPYLCSKVKIRTVRLAKNLTVDELLALKDEETEALSTLIDMRNDYNQGAIAYKPPYKKSVFHLTQDELTAAGIEPTTNHLSQVVFVETNDVVICIPGDLEEASWELMLNNEAVTNLLERTSIFFASHHGRENGYHPDIFNYCFPDCIIISDKEIMHATQEGMAGLYSPYVIGDGIILKHGSGNMRRKVLSTRKDGHVLIRINARGNTEFHALGR